jgi:hypothetical protein
LRELELLLRRDVVPLERREPPLPLPLLLLRLDPLLLRAELPPLRDEPPLLREEPLLLREEPPLRELPVLREELREEVLRLDPLLRDELPPLRDELPPLREEPPLLRDDALRPWDRLLELLELDRLRLVVLRRERVFVRSSRGISARTTSLTRRSNSA